MKKNVLKQLDMIALADHIRVVCKTVDGYAVFEPGWSDQRIVEESQGRLTINNVVPLRTQLCGPLASKATADASLIAALNARLAKLEAWAAARPVHPFKVEP